MQTIPYTNDKINYIGRFLTPTTGMQTAWSGSQVRFKVSGTSQIILVCDVQDVSNTIGAFLCVSIDNSESVTNYYLTNASETITGERSVTITLPNTAEHLITFKFTSGWQNEQFSQSAYIRFKSIVIDDNGTLLPYSQQGKLIMCIGDSWIGAENDWPRFLDNSLYSIYPVGYGGAKASDINTDYPFQASGISKYGDPIADGVIICLGINDYVLNVTTTSYKSTMSSLINKVRADQPNAPIFLLQAPRNLNTGATFDQYGGVLSELAAEKTNVFYISSQSIWSSLIWSDNYHISSKQIFGNYISSQISSYFPEIQPEPESKTTFELTTELGTEELSLVPTTEENVVKIEIYLNGEFNKFELVDVDDLNDSNFEIYLGAGEFKRFRKV